MSEFSLIIVTTDIKRTTVSQYICRSDFLRLDVPFGWETALRRSREGLAPPIIRLSERTLAFRANEFAAWAARDFQPDVLDGCS